MRDVDVTEVARAVSWLTPARRGWLYRVATAVVALAGLYGLVSGEEAAAWLAVVTALVATPVAAIHTPTGKD